MNQPSNSSNNLHKDHQLEVATFGAGCFWCVEAIFQELDGVHKVMSGYSGGDGASTYKEVCSGTTGHAEVVQISYDPAKIEYATLLEVFFATHDPTTLNRQGADTGAQYRSVIFYHDDEQKELAEKARDAANASGVWANPVVTEISPATDFYEAEAYHQNYYSQNSDQAYCSIVITPKVDKFKKQFRELLRKGKAVAE